MSDSMPEEEKFQRWVAKTWRPFMAYTYIGICIFDFIIAPILWAIVQAMQGTKLTTPWVPMSLQGAGLFHAAMGAILGVAAWGRSKEKLAYMERIPPMDYDPNRYRNQPRGRDDRDIVYGREE